MKKHDSSRLLVARRRLGCFGSDPKMNSQCLHAAPPGTTGDRAPDGRPGNGRHGGAAPRSGAIVGSPLATFDTGPRRLRVRAPTTSRPNLNGAGSSTKGTLSFDSAGRQPEPRLAEGDGAVLGRQPVRRRPEELRRRTTRRTGRARRCTSASAPPRDLQGRRAGLRDHDRRLRLRRQVHQLRRTSQLAGVHASTSAARRRRRVACRTPATIRPRSSCSACS